MDKIFFTRRSNGLGRTGYAWMETPGAAIAGGTMLEMIGPHTQKRDHRGMLIEDFHRNYLLRSSNQLGVAGISPGSLNGTGTNGSAIADDSLDRISGPITNPFPKSYKFTAGNPHTVDTYVQLPNSLATGTMAEVDPNAPYWLTMWLKNDVSATSADEVVWEAQRPIAAGGDDQWWNHGSQIWQASAVWNSTGNKTAGAVSRYLARIFDDPATQPGIKVRFGLKSGGTASRTAHVYHAGLDKCSFPAWSTILADQADAAGYPGFIEAGTDEYRHDCSGGDPLSVARGTLLMRAILPFGFAGLFATSDPRFFKLIGASSNFTAGIDFGTPTIYFAYGATTVSVAPGAAMNVAPMGEYRIACRWTSSLAELGLDRQATLFFTADGSTFYQSSASISTMTDGAAQAWFPGGAGGNRPSWFFRWEVLPICLSDAEIRARLA